MKTTLTRDEIRWDGDRTAYPIPQELPARHWISDRRLKRMLHIRRRTLREVFRAWRWRHSQDRWALWHADFFRAPAGHFWRIATPFFVLSVWNNFADFMTRDIRTGFEFCWSFNRGRDVGEYAFLRSIRSIDSCGKANREWAP